MSRQPDNQSEQEDRPSGLRDGKSKEISINRCVAEYISIYREKYIDIFDQIIFSLINTHPPPSISLINDNFLDGLSKLTRIITYFQTRKHEKLITTFFTGYFHLHPFVIKT